MIREDDDGFDQGLDEYAPFAGRGGLPYLLNVDGGKEGGDFLEAFGQLVVAALIGLDLCSFRAQGPDLCGEPALFVGEGLGADLVGVVQVQQLAEFLIECTQGGLPGWSFRCPGWFEVAAEFGADGGLKIGVRADEPKSQFGGTVQSFGRPPRLVAALAAVLAAVDGLAAFVVVDADQPSAHAALDASGQQVPPAPSAGTLARCAASNSACVTRGWWMPGNQFGPRRVAPRYTRLCRIWRTVE